MCVIICEMERSDEHVCNDVCFVINVKDYYQFGKRISQEPTLAEEFGGRNNPAVASRLGESSRTIDTTVDPNRWHFSGKEAQSFLNASIPLLDFGARMYNPTIARWTTSDPLSERYYGFSPYAYCLGDPISSRPYFSQNQLKFSAISPKTA